MTSVIGTKFSLSSFYGRKKEEPQMLYKMRQKVLSNSHGIRKAARGAMKKGRVKMSLKYQDLNTLDSFHAVVPPAKIKKKISKRKKSPQIKIEVQHQRPSRLASTEASKKMSSLDAAVFSDEDSDEDFGLVQPKSVKLRKRIFKEAQDTWSSSSDDDDDDWKLGATKRKTVKKRVTSEPPPLAPILSEYEISVQKKIAERQKFLEELGIFETKQELQELQHSSAPLSRKSTKNMQNQSGSRISKDVLSSPPSNTIREISHSPEPTMLVSSIPPASGVIDFLDKEKPPVATNETDRASSSFDDIAQDSIARTNSLAKDIIPKTTFESTAPKKTYGRKATVLTEQAETVKKIPQVLKRLRTTALNAAEQAKSTKIVPRKLKRNLNKLVQSDSHPRRAVRTLGDTKWKLGFKMA